MAESAEQRSAAAAEPASRRALRRLAYAGALFLASAGGLILEIVAGRMIAPYVGMSLYTWTAVIAVVLAGFSIGHWIGGRLATQGHARASWRLCWLLGLAAVATVACLPLIRLVAPQVLGAGLHPVTAIVLLTAALFLLPSLFVGAVSPVLTTLAVHAQPEAPGRAIGRMFAAGAVGSIAGTLAAGYLMISWIGSIGSVLAVGGGYLVLAGAFAWAARPSPARAAAAAALLLAALAVLGLGAGVRAFTSPCLVESEYYCIQVIDFSAESGRPSALMVLDHLGHGINDRDDPTRLHASYLALTDRLLRERLDGRERFTAFFIGGGANSLPRAWSAGYPQASLLVAEIDPAVTRVAREAMWFEARDNTTVEHRDARVALHDLPDGRRFDVIVGDAFHDISVPQHLTTLEFARLLQRRLTPRGFYALNVVDGSRRPLFLLAVARTLGAVLPQVEVWLDPDQVRAGGRVTYLVVAGQEGFAQGRLASAEPDGPRWIRWPAEELARAIERSGVPLLTDDYAPVDRLMLPVLAEEP